MEFQTRIDNCKFFTAGDSRVAIHCHNHTEPVPAVISIDQAVGVAITNCTILTGRDEALWLRWAAFRRHVRRLSSVLTFPFRWVWSHLRKPVEQDIP